MLKQAGPHLPIRQIGDYVRVPTHSLVTRAPYDNPRRVELVLVTHVERGQRTCATKSIGHVFQLALRVEGKYPGRVNLRLWILSRMRFHGRVETGPDRVVCMQQVNQVATREPQTSVKVADHPQVARI